MKIREIIVVGLSLVVIALLLFFVGYFLGRQNNETIIVDMTTFEAYDIGKEDNLRSFIKTELREGQNYIIISQNREKTFGWENKLFETIDQERPECSNNATIAVTGLENPGSSKYNHTETGMYLARFYILTDEMLERSIKLRAHNNY